MLAPPAVQLVYMRVVQAALKTRARFNSESTARWSLRLPSAVLQPLLWYSLFVNDHFPMDYQRAVQGAQMQPTTTATSAGQ